MVTTTGNCYEEGDFKWRAICAKTNTKGKCSFWN